jgi:hypothetical protein
MMIRDSLTKATIQDTTSPLRQHRIQWADELRRPCGKLNRPRQLMARMHLCSLVSVKIR